MTTVAWDGKFLASDSRVTNCSHLISNEYRKLYEFTDVIYNGDKLLAIGMAGTVADFERVAHMLVQNELGHTGAENRSEVDAIVVGEKFVYELEEGQSYLIRYDRKTKLAMGSGGCFARAAMQLKKNAKQAVKLAMELDCSTGGEVQYLIF